MKRIWCDACKETHEYDIRTALAPFLRKCGWKFISAPKDGDCFYSCVQSAFSGRQNLTVAEMRGWVADKVTEDQWQIYQTMAIAQPQEQWLEFAREEEKSAPEPSDEPPPAASVGSEEAEVTPPEESDEDAAARRERHARCRCFDLLQLKDFIRKEGSINGEDECLWADEFAFQIVAQKLNVNILLIDMDRSKGSIPYRTLARAAPSPPSASSDAPREGARAPSYMVLRRQKGVGHYVLLAQEKGGDSGGGNGSNGGTGGAPSRGVLGGAPPDRQALFSRADMPAVISVLWTLPCEPATAAVPAPTLSPMPSQPLTADRAASDDEEDPTPRPCCLMTGCSRPRRVRFRHGRGFPVGAFTWVCCSQCTLGEHDANGVKVHSATCNALTGFAPSSSAVPTADALADSAPAPSALLPTAYAADARTEPAPAPVAVPTVDFLSRNLAALERRDIENDLRRRGVLAPEPPLALAPAPTPASTPTDAEPQLPTAAHASSRAPVTAAHLPALLATTPLPAPVPAPTGHTLAASRKKGKSSAAGSGASAETAGGGASGASASGTFTGLRQWPHHNRPAPTPSPKPLPQTARPRPSTTRSHVGGGASDAAGATDSARAALARAQSPPAHCATPSCCRPRKEWRVDRATFLGVQVCCERCGVEPPGAAATPHTRDCNAAEAARLRQLPPATCATAGCGRPRRVWRVYRSNVADIQVCCTHCGYEGHSWGCNAVEEERQGQPPPALY